jgi:hypothetical protein
MRIPFFTELEKSRNVLLAGAGGGFDVFSGLPLYFWLRNNGKTVHVANLSFTQLGFCDGERPSAALMRIKADTSGPTNYFPEGHLSRWLTDRYGETPVWAIERTGVRPIAEAYDYLVRTLQPDTIVLVDGGMDSLLRGDEAGLGTPEEDMATLFAAAACPESIRKFIVAVGFGIDTFHGVCHAHVLEDVAALIEDGGYLGAWSLMKEMEEFRLYQDAYEFVAARMRQPSIVNTSIISAVNGWFGNRHATKRTEGSELFINPLMPLYWAFNLEHVARRNLYFDHIRGTETYQQLSLAIERFRATHPKTKTWMEMPC